MTMAMYSRYSGGNGPCALMSDDDVKREQEIIYERLGQFIIGGRTLLPVGHIVRPAKSCGGYVMKITGPGTLADFEAQIALVCELRGVPIPRGMPWPFFYKAMVAD